MLIAAESLRVVDKIVTKNDVVGELLHYVEVAGSTSSNCSAELTLDVVHHAVHKGAEAISKLEACFVF